ncbi:uncharacterized protein [Marmota flaviventris]|uniref:uncharacterized protein n=1 Tax=Marmota flaviventris TaxID=93162 RepID=UPI003A88A5BD
MPFPHHSSETNAAATHPLLDSVGLVEILPTPLYRSSDLALTIHLCKSLQAPTGAPYKALNLASRVVTVICHEQRSEGPDFSRDQQHNYHQSPDSTGRRQASSHIAIWTNLWLLIFLPQITGGLLKNVTYPVDSSQAVPQVFLSPISMSLSLPSLPVLRLVFPGLAQ